jgi:hypothetical protein
MGRLKVPGRPRLGWWAPFTLVLVAGTVLSGDLDRFENPQGEKHVYPYGGGQVDFSYTYMGARALLAGVNPYHHDRPEFTSGIWPPSDYGGFKQIYPPGSLLMQVPLVLWKGTDWQAAARIWFRFSLVALALLAMTTWMLARRILATPLDPLWIPFLFVCLTLNAGVELALERGQSDIQIALLAWGAVACFLQGQPGVSIFLAMWGVSIKGYPILLAAGLFLLALKQRPRKNLFAGTAAGMVVFVLPVWRYWGEALRAARVRADVFWAVWYNHGFGNAAHYLMPAWRAKGRLVLSLFAFAVAIVAWFQSHRALNRGAPGGGALWLVTFAVAALGVMIGWPSLSISYNLVLVLPGVLLLVASQERLRLALVLRRGTEHALGAALLIISILLFTFRIGGAGPPGGGTGFPSSAFGLVGLFPFLAVVLARALSSRDPLSGRTESRRS